jgi:hypothetical protein
MKIVLDLSKSYNNYHWNDTKELKDYIKYMKMVLWKYYNDYLNDEGIYTTENTSENDKDRFYDILDMFESFEVYEK